ncbi:sugar-transfer associated ATP-grasp domain-containing protein [Microbacterium halophytorum]|uniref:sugar-transfer associated ATP-grasp domain-containing protein n=1 Tax=Microbacterium halophytorum TaxID=2067568 RepID=UPI000CFB4263|nr:sugar-transfer associated ATP-grasp domain-containing protein [Microbacterium halophytorum]
MKRIGRRAKRAVVGAMSQPLIRRGMTPIAARLRVRSDLRVRTGAADAQEFSFGVNDFYDLHPINRRRQWLNNRVIARRVVPGLGESMEDALCVLSLAKDSADGISVVGLRAFPESESTDVDGLVAAIAERRAVRVMPMRWDRGPGVVVTADRGRTSIAGREVTRDEFAEALVELVSRTRCVVVADSARARLLDGRDPADTLLRLYVGRTEDRVRVLDAEILAGDALERRDGERASEALLSRPPFFDLSLSTDRFAHREQIDADTGESTSGAAVPGYAAFVSELIGALCRATSAFRFISVDVAVGADGVLRIIDIARTPVFPAGRGFGEAAEEFLRELRDETADVRRRRAVRVAVRRDLRRRVELFRMRANGFTGRSAREWTARCRSDALRGFPSKEVQRAHEWGFEASVVRRFGITSANRASFLSRREYLYAQPLNGAYAKWIRDRVSALMVFHPFAELFAPTHYQIYRRSRGVHFVPLSEEARSAGATLDAMAGILKRGGEMELRPTRWRDRVVARVGHDGTDFLVDGAACTPGEFQELLATYARRSIVLVEPRVWNEEPQRVVVTMLNAAGDDPNPVEALLRIPASVPRADGSPGGEVVLARIDPDTGRYSGARLLLDGEILSFADHPNTGRPIEGEVAGWADAVAQLRRMCRFAPQLRYMQFTLDIARDGIEIRRIAEKPRLSDAFPASRATIEFVREQADEKRRRTEDLRSRIGRGAHNAKLRIRREFAEALYPKGLLPYQSVRWLGDMRRDLFQRNGVSLKTKLWAYRNGFLSYRIPQYGITPENRLEFISDFEYRWLRHINTRYKYWLEDKVSIKYVASDFNEFLPAYFYATSPSAGVNHLIPMMDCPEGYGAEFEDVLRLAREKGVLALKPDEGSHGDGFYRLGFEDGGYTLNGEPATGDEVLAILRDPENRYLVTEFIVMHPVLAEIYPTSVNTIRMTVFKKDAVTPQLGNAYLRIGSAASGFVDNTAAGGLLAEIDIASGRFGNAKSLVNGRVVDTPNHPDTGVFIDGVVPHWAFVKEQVLLMAASFSQLEYLGFDVAITEDGFKIPEINRFPDFPRIDRLEPETIEYLLMKLDEKKRQYGYHRRRPRTIISLPKRDTA